MWCDSHGWEGKREEGERERRWERGGGGEREGRRGDVGEKERVGEGRWKIGSGRERVGKKIGGAKDVLKGKFWRDDKHFEVGRGRE